MTPEDPGADGEAPQLADGKLHEEGRALRGSEGIDRQANGGQRWRRVSSWVLVVLACVLAVVSVVVVFARNQLLNTDTYVSTVAPLASDPAIQTAVAKQVSQNLIAHTDVEQRVKNALPPKAGFLATPITSGVQSATNEITVKLVQSQQFQKVWVAANRVSHKQLVALLTGSKDGALASSNGKVTIDLSQVEVKAKEALDAKGVTVFNKVPAVKGLDFVLFQSEQLARFQRLTRLLNNLALVLPIVTLLLFAGGIVLARNRRRGLVRAAAGLALSMALVLVVISIARNQYLSSLSPARSQAANAAVIDTVSAVLRDTVRTILFVAALIAFGALIAGNSRLRAWLADMSKPSWMTDGPVHGFVAVHRKGLQWAVLGVGLLLLVVWNNPTTLVAVIVLLVTLAVVGMVGLFAGRGSTTSAADRAAGDRVPAIGAGGSGNAADSAKD